jgi:hypothetical protein
MILRLVCLPVDRPLPDSPNANDPWPELDEEAQLSSPGVDPDMIKFFADKMGGTSNEEEAEESGALPRSATKRSGPPTRR